MSTYEASLHTPLANRSSFAVFLLFVLSTSHFQLVAMNNNGETANTSWFLPSTSPNSFNSWLILSSFAEIEASIITIISYGYRKLVVLAAIFANH